MKQKKLTKVVLLCVLGLFLSVSFVNAEIPEKVIVIKKNQSPAYKFYQNFMNNSFSGQPINIHVKNADCNNFLSNAFKLAKIPYVFKTKLKKTVTLKVSKIPYDFIISFIITQNNLQIELDGDKLIIKDKENEL